MHEGLLILPKKATTVLKSDILFCNKPAQKLLTQAKDFHEAQLSEEQQTRTQNIEDYSATEAERLFTYKIFSPLEID